VSSRPPESQNPRSERENRGTSRYGIDLPPSVVEALDAYAELLRRWAPRLNLVGTGDLTFLEERHLGDSLRLLRFVAEAPPGPCIDVGSGAGLPGIPLALALPKRHWRLLEPRRNRAAFLERAVRELGVEAEVVVDSAEGAARKEGFAAAHAVATARALAPPPDALKKLLPLVRPGGLALLLQGRNAVVSEGTEVPEPGIAIVRTDRGIG
jgi:16S rRNA (guanine527-N7)-methyltransferase